MIPNWCHIPLATVPEANVGSDKFPSSAVIGWGPLSLKLRCGVSNLGYMKRASRILKINRRSKLNNYAFQLSNPISIFIRNIFLKYLSKNKSFLENYLGRIYNN